MSSESKWVAGMAFVRLISATIEVTAALLMLRLGRIDAAAQINAALGLVGPAIFIVVSMLGIAGLAGRIPLSRTLIIAAGVLLILYGSRGGSG